jgi:pyruvate formate lyase activating enzyme
MEHLGPDVPLHFTAFHPDWKMLDKPPTPPATLTRARDIAVKNGLHYAYTGNVHDEEGDSTYCHNCGEKLIGRDWYVLGDWNLTDDGRCRFCGAACAGVFDGAPGKWGPRRLPVLLHDYARLHSDDGLSPFSPENQWKFSTSMMSLEDESRWT